MSWKPRAAQGSLSGFSYTVFRLQVALLDFKTHHVDVYLISWCRMTMELRSLMKTLSETSKAALRSAPAYSQTHHIILILLFDLFVWLWKDHEILIYGV